MTRQRFSQFIAAPPSAVYRALLDPRLIERWRVPAGMRAAVRERLPPGVSPRDNAIGWRDALGKLARLLAVPDAAP